MGHKMTNDNYLCGIFTHTQESTTVMSSIKRTWPLGRSVCKTWQEGAMPVRTGGPQCINFVICIKAKSDDIDFCPLKSFAKPITLHSSSAGPRLARLSDICLLVGYIHIHIYRLSSICWWWCSCGCAHCGECKPRLLAGQLVILSCI